MEDDQQFCLRWNNHQSTLIQNFDTLLESGTLVDCTLAAEGQSLKAHKVVLSACSPYFEGLLSEHYDKHPVFILKDVKFKELKAMMDYMYRGEVNISQDQLAALLKAAESLQIKGLSESKTGGSSKTDTRQQKVVSQPTAAASDIPHPSSGLTIEKNKVPRQGMAQGSVGDLPEDSASPQVPKGLSSREGSQSPTARKRKRLRRRSVGEDNSIETHEASNSSDMPQQMNVPALGITPVADEKAHADPTDSLGRSALMTQLTKPADEMLQLPLEKPEPNDSLLEPKSEYLDDPEEGVEDLTLDDDMNDLNEMEQDTNRAGPSHDPSQHPPGIGTWHVTSGERSNAGGVGSVATGAPGATDEVFLAAHEAAQAHRDSQVYGRRKKMKREVAVASTGGSTNKRIKTTVVSARGSTNKRVKTTVVSAGGSTNKRAKTTVASAGGSTSKLAEVVASAEGSTNNSIEAAQVQDDTNTGDFRKLQEWVLPKRRPTDPNAPEPDNDDSRASIDLVKLERQYTDEDLLQGFTCDNCGKIFRILRTLLSHKSNDCGKIYSCPCGGTFSYRASFCKHRKKCIYYRHSAHQDIAHSVFPQKQ